MFLTKLKIATAVALTLAVAGMGGGMFTYNTWAREKGQEKKDTATPKDKGESKPEVAANAPAPAKDAKPAPLAPPVEPNRARHMYDLLAKTVNFAGEEDPKSKFIEMLDQIASQYNITFDVNERAFEAEGIKDVLGVLLGLGEKPLPSMKGVLLSTVLKKILSRIPNVEAAFVVRRDHIEITTKNALLEEFPKAAGFPLVTASFEKTPLEDAIKELSTSTGFNIVLDTAKVERAQPTVTANLHNVPVDTAVRILAELADMRAVLLDNVLFVTATPTAERMRKEEAKRKGEEVEEKPAPAAKPMQ